MRILAVSVGKAKNIKHMGKVVSTGIYKSPVPGPVMIWDAGVEGDQQANLEAHGGPDKTIHAFPIENYSYYQSRFGNDEFAHGHFGENLTTSGLSETEVRIGDRLRVGKALLEVTMPRMPCFKFGIKLGSAMALRECIESGRTGFYLRVLEAGAVTEGDPVDVVVENAGFPTVHDIHRLRFHDKRDAQGLRWALTATALSQVVRGEFERRLRDLASNSATDS